CRAGQLRHLHRRPRRAAGAAGASGPCLPSAQFALSINRRVWAAAGFDTALQALLANGRIRDLQTIEVQVYGQAAADIDPAHAADLAEVVFLRAA
ncbi:MAG: hypothetical protein WBP18_17555, partial [Paracoccaceae bacterium]